MAKLIPSLRVIRRHAGVRDRLRALAHGRAGAHPRQSRRIAFRHLDGGVALMARHLPVPGSQRGRAARRARATDRAAARMVSRGGRQAAARDGARILRPRAGPRAGAARLLPVRLPTSLVCEPDVSLPLLAAGVAVERVETAAVLEEFLDAYIAGRSIPQGAQFKDNVRPWLGEPGCSSISGAARGRPAAVAILYVHDRWATAPTPPPIRPCAAAACRQPCSPAASPTRAPPASTSCAAAPSSCPRATATWSAPACACSSCGRCGRGWGRAGSLSPAPLLLYIEADVPLRVEKSGWAAYLTGNGMRTRRERTSYGQGQEHDLPVVRQDAEAAARFYAATFPDSAVGAVLRAPSDYRPASRRRADGPSSRSPAYPVSASTAVPCSSTTKLLVPDRHRRPARDRPLLERDSRQWRPGERVRLVQGQVGRLLADPPAC